MDYLVFSCWALVGLVMAQNTINCRMGTPQISLPSCMETCFLTGGCNNCPCANNLKGWCEIESGEGPDSWSARWGQCVLGSCPDDGDITNLMLLYVAQCEGTVGGPLNNDTVPYPLRDWAPKASQYLSQSAFAPSTTGSSASSSVQTLTSTVLSATGSLESANGSEATGLQAATSSSTHNSTASSLSEAQEDSKPALSVATIVGIAVGGAALLALIVGLVALTLRRRRRKAFATLGSHLTFAEADVKDEYDKPKLDSHVLAYQHVKADTGAPVQSPMVYAELDGSRPRSPVLEMSGRP